MHRDANATQARRARHLSVAVVLCAGFACSMAVFAACRQLEAGKAHRVLQAIAAEQAAALRAAAAATEAIVHGIGGLHAVSARVDADTFRRFAETMTVNRLDVRAVSWIERVAAVERDELARRARADDHAGLDIHAYDGRRDRPDAGHGRDHYVLHRSYRRDGQVPAPGLDLASRAVARDRLDAARDSGAAFLELDDRASGRGVAGMRLYLPVYGEGGVPDAVAARRRQLRGFARIELDPEEFVNVALRDRSDRPGGVDEYLFDPRDRKLLHFRGSRAPPARAPALPVEALNSRGVLAAVAIADRRLQLAIVPAPGRHDANAAAGPRLVLAAGFALSVLLAMYVACLHRRREEIAVRGERLRAVVDGLAHGVVTFDSHGTVHSVNPAAERLLGYPPGGASGLCVETLFSLPRNGRDLAELVTSRRAGGVAAFVEIGGRGRDGGASPVEVALSAMPIDNGTVFVAAVREVAERREIERNTTGLVVAACQELRSPLAAANAALGQVLGDGALAIRAGARPVLSTARRSGERLTLLIDGVLDLAKIGSGRLHLQPRRVDLQDVVRQSLEDILAHGGRHGARVELNGGLFGASVLADRQRLLQVMANLLSCAVGCSSERGVARVRLERRGERFRVSARGHGPATATAWSVPASGGVEQAGGLCYRIAGAIIARHGGQLGCDREPGGDSTFWFDLAGHRLQSPPGARDRVPARVLICEGRADVCLALARLLDSDGFECDIVNSVAVARELLTARDYQAMLLGLTLSDQDGLSFIAELRADARTLGLPIVVACARTHEGTARYSGAAVSVLDWIHKPIDRDRLDRVLTPAVHRTRGLRILQVADSRDVLRAVRDVLAEGGEYHCERTLAGARARLALGGFDLLIVDLDLPDGSGADLLCLDDGCSVIIVSARESPDAVSDRLSVALCRSTSGHDTLLRTLQRAIQASAGGASDPGGAGQGTARPGVLSGRAV